jgi:RNA-splicing ligase RtcB
MNWDMITLRKGAVSAWPDEKLVIPMNMRDGTILAKGKGNQNWNFSAPHGAGRVLSRSQAKKRLEVSEFKKEMNGIFTTCISKDTLDEAPMAYKPMAQIIEHIGDTIEILDILKPVYNYKV